LIYLQAMDEISHYSDCPPFSHCALIFIHYVFLRFVFQILELDFGLDWHFHFFKSVLHLEV